MKSMQFCEQPQHLAIFLDINVRPILWGKSSYSLRSWEKWSPKVCSGFYILWTTLYATYVAHDIVMPMSVISLCIYFTANPEQLCSCHPPWFKDTPHWPCNRHSSSNNSTCDSTQTQAKWKSQIWRCLAVERRSKCMSHTVWPNTLTVQSFFFICTHCFFLLSNRNQRVMSRGRTDLKWSTRPSGPRRCQTECGGHLFRLNRCIEWNKFKCKT